MDTLDQEALDADIDNAKAALKEARARHNALQGLRFNAPRYVADEEAIFMARYLDVPLKKWDEDLCIFVEVPTDDSTLNLMMHAQESNSWDVHVKDDAVYMGGC